MASGSLPGEGSQNRDLVPLEFDPRCDRGREPLDLDRNQGLEGLPGLRQLAEQPHRDRTRRFAKLDEDRFDLKVTRDQLPEGVQTPLNYVEWVLGPVVEGLPADRRGDT